MAVFRAYFDASGSLDDPATNVLTVAGYVATEEQWSKFDDDWGAVLNSEGLRAFHMKDFAQSVNQFAGWKGDETRRRRFLQRLSGIIGSQTERGFAVSLELDPYRAVNTVYRLDEFAKPYPLACATLISEVDHWLSANHPEKSYVLAFEKGDADQGDLLPLLERLEFDLPVDPVFLKKHWVDESGVELSCLAFQAADFMAYEHSKNLGDFFRMAKTQARRSLFVLSEATGHIDRRWRTLGFGYFKALCQPHVQSKGALRMPSILLVSS